MGSAAVTAVLLLMLVCISHSVKSSQVKHQNCQVGEFGCGDRMCIAGRKVCDGTWDCSNGQDETDCSMQGIFQNVGNEKTARFPVYKEVKGFDIYLRFTATQCRGKLLEITSRDHKQFLRITLLEVGPIRVSFNTLRGKGQLDIAMRSKGSFCDGKRHLFTLTLFRGAVFYNVDRSSYVRYYVARLGVPFSSPDKIVLGRGLHGCISGSTVIVRFNRTQEHVLGVSAGCAVKKTTVRPSKPPVFTYSARKIATETTVQPSKPPVFTYSARKIATETTVQPSKPPVFTYRARKIATSKAPAGPKCEPLTLTACKDLGYNLTQVPNGLQHKTSYQASSKFLVLLSRLQTKCSPHLIPFLCQLYLPPCVLPQSAAPPCRSLCESVQEDCALVGRMDHWPFQLSCEKFPRANNNTKCFLGSIKVTSKRTTLLRGESVQEEDLTETNSMKKASDKSKRYPTKPVKTETTAISDQTTVNSENRWPKSTVREKKSTPKEKLMTDDKEKELTEPARPTASQLSDKLASVDKSVMNGHSLSVETKGISGSPPTPKRKAPATTAQSYTRINKRQSNETMLRATMNTNTSSQQVNSSSVLSWTPTTENNAGGCGGVLATPNGQLMSPGYPAGYPSNTTCRWTIALPNDYHVIRFTFHGVYLEEDRNCVYDYIAVYDMLDNQVGQRYCGSITSPVYKDVKGNVAVVVFRSDSANSKKGFVLSYKARKCLTSTGVEN